MFFKLIKTITALSYYFVTIDNFFVITSDLRYHRCFFYLFSPKFEFFEIKHKIDFTIHINPESVEKNIHELTTMRISFALDNYGTDYSHVKKLINLPF